MIDEAEDLGRRLSETLSLTEANEKLPQEYNRTQTALSAQARSSEEAGEEVAPRRDPPPVISAVPNARLPVGPPARATPRLAHPSDISARLYSNPVIAALRPGLSVVPTPSPSLVSLPVGATSTSIRPAMRPPILINPKCSGYFVEPVRELLAFTFNSLLKSIQLRSSNGWSLSWSRDSCQGKLYALTIDATPN